MKELPDPRRKTFRTVVRIAQAGTLLSLGGLTFLALRSGHWQVWGTVIITSLLLLFAQFTVFLAQQGHFTAAVWTLFLSGEIAFLGSGMLIADLGWMLGLGIMALIASMSTLLLPQKQRLLAIGSALLTAFSLLGIDALAPAYRLALSTTFQLYLFALFTPVGVAYLIYYARFINPTLRASLFSALLILTLLPLGLFAPIALRTLENRLRENISFQLYSAARLSAEGVDEFISTTLEKVNSYAQLPETVEFLQSPNSDPSKFQELRQTLRMLSRTADPLKAAFSYGLLDKNGINVVDSIFANIGEDESNEIYFQEVLRTGHSYISDVNARTNAFTFAAPVKDINGKVLGVLRAHYNASILQVLLVKNREQASRSSFAVLADENGIILAHGDNSQAKFRLLAPLPEKELEALQAAERLPKGSNEELSLNLPAVAALLRKGEPRMVTSEIHPVQRHLEVIVAQPLRTRPWTLFYAQQESYFLGPVRRQFLIFNMLAFVFGIAAAVTSLVLANRLVQPILLLTQAAQRVRQGDLTVQLNLQRRDESGFLAETFNAMTAQIRELVSSLEARVAERTRQLEERSLLLQHAAEIGRIITSTLDPQQLMEQAVNLIQERFGLYYVGLFELDGSGEWAVLGAGSGEAGRKMLVRGHRIRVGTGMIGWCIANNQARIAQQAELDEVRLHTPELPETRSEAALPLRSRGQVIGAISIQSDQPNAFTPENLAIFQILADQLAAALDNAYLFVESQESLRAIERAYAERTRVEWRQTLLRLRQPFAFRSLARGSIPISPVYSADVAQALKSGEVILETDMQSPGGRHFISVPIKIRGHVIGVLRTYKPAERGPWSDEEIDALRTIADQVGIALEAARLYGDTQRRAERERLLAEITTRIRSVSDPEEMINTALDTLRRALSVRAVRIVPATPENGEEKSE
ncbi:MAG: GAF domain-containing protein [Anaerolineales bacterium]